MRRWPTRRPRPSLYRGSGLRTAILWGVVPAARAALWAGEDERLSAAIDEIDASGLRGRWVTAIMTTLRAGLAARRGDLSAARRRYAEAAAVWRRLDVPLQLALCDLEAAHHLPAGSAEAAAAGDEARSTLELLGASTLIARLEDGLTADGAERPVAERPVAGARG